MKNNFFKKSVTFDVTVACNPRHDYKKGVTLGVTLV
jgi:hypothetical protein